jgi:hypothetical protein
MKLPSDAGALNSAISPTANNCAAAAINSRCGVVQSYGLALTAEYIPESCPRRMVTAHPMNAPSWWSRSGAQINSAQWRAIRRGAQDWACNQLRQIRSAAIDVAAGQIRIRFFKIDSACAVTCENAIAKTGSEALYL